MAHIRTLMLNELLVRSSGLSLVPIANVRVDPTSPTHSPSIPGVTIRTGPEAETPFLEEVDCVTLERTWSVLVEIRTGTPEADGSKLANDILEELLPALFQDDDLGGLADQMRVGAITFLSADAEVSYNLLTVTLNIRYAYEPADPSTPTH